MKTSAVVDPVVGAAKLPFRTVAWSFGVLRGLAGSVIRIASGDHGTTTPSGGAGPVATPVADRAEAPVEPAPVLDFDPVEPAPEREPEEPHEAFVNEPKAVSRESAHGGSGRDAEIDDWYGEMDAEDDAADTVVEALARNDGPGPLVDESAIKATLSESEILRQAADPDKG